LALLCHENVMYTHCSPNGKLAKDIAVLDDCTWSI